MAEKDKKQSPKPGLGRMTLFYILELIITCAATLSYSGYRHYDRTLAEQGEAYSVAAGQMRLTVEEYFDKLQDASIALMTNPDFSDFNAADPTLDRYERAQKLSELKTSITRVSLMDNYCDFAIIYSDSTDTGKLSEGTHDLLCVGGKQLYPAVNELMNGEKSLWVTGINEDFNKIYYIRSVGNDSYFLGGFYTEELSNAFSVANGSDEVSFYLLDRDEQVVFSLNGCDELSFYRDDAESYVRIEYYELTAVETLDNGWKVVLHKDMNDTIIGYKRNAIEVSAFIIAAMAVLVVFNVITARSSGIYAANMSVTPTMDALTGLHNAEDAENLIADRIETCISGSTIMLALVSIKNLDEIEARYGRSGYNGAIIKTYRGLAEFFGTDDPSSPNIIGRVGENEYVVFADYTEYDLFKANDKLKEGLAELSAKLDTVHIGQEGDMVICVGAAVYPHSSTDYDELYDHAKQALTKALANKEQHYALHKHKDGKGGRKQ